MLSKFYIAAPKERPDFRLVPVFLWGASQDVDSEGDADDPASRRWTELWMYPRNANGEIIEEEGFGVCPLQEDPLILEVSAPKAEIAARVAYLLAWYTQGQVKRTEVGWEDPGVLIPLLGVDFDVADALKRFRNSSFARATQAKPYPDPMDT